MIKNIVENNKKVSIESIREKQYLISKFKDANGNVDLENLKNFIENDGKKVIKEGYSLNFLGKRASELLSGLESTTVFVPDEEHNGKEENKNSENIYISADNLEALRHLKNSYHNKIKCIYIDPPYNTGNDGFCYNDKFGYNKETLSEKLGIEIEEAERILSMQSNKSNSHSAWLTFMYTRLLLSYELLDKDGVIFISIDDHEYANLKLVCDDIFGEENFINNFMWLHGKGKKDKCSRTLQQYCLCYAKCKEELLEWNEKEYTNYEFINPDNDPKGKWFSGSLSFSEERSNPLHENYYKIISPSGVEWLRQWQKPKSEIEELIKNKDIYWGDPPEYNAVPREKIRPGIIDTIPSNIIDGVGSTKSAEQELNQLLGRDCFSYPKPTKLIIKLLEFMQLKEGFVLDFFSGSATTGDAIMQYNIINKSKVKYLLVQLDEKLEDKLLKANTEEKKILNNQIALLDQYKLPHTLNYIGYIRLKKAMERQNEKNEFDCGFKHFILSDKIETLDKLESFDPNMAVISQDLILSEFSPESRLITFLCDDGFGLTAKCDEIDLSGYKAYFINGFLYLLDKGFDSTQIALLIEKVDKCEIKLKKIIIFGYAFDTRSLQQLKDNAEKLGIDDDKDIIIKY